MLLLALATGVVPAAAQVEHAFRRDGGLAVEALAAALEDLDGDGLGIRAGDPVIVRLQAALTLGPEHMTGVAPLAHPAASEGARDPRFPIARLAGWVVARLPEAAWQRWQDVHATPAGPLERAAIRGDLAALDALSTRFVGTEAFGRAMVEGAARALEEGRPEVALGRLFRYRDAFAPLPVRAPLGWARAGFLLAQAALATSDPALFEEAVALLSREDRIEVDGAASRPAVAATAMGAKGLARPLRVLQDAPSTGEPYPVLERAFHLDLDQPGAGRPMDRPAVVVAGGRLYTCDRGILRAVSLEDGGTCWSRRLDGENGAGATDDAFAESALAAGDGLLAVTIPRTASSEGGGRIFGFDLESGRPRFARGGPSDADPYFRMADPASGPLVAEGLIVVALLVPAAASERGPSLDLVALDAVRGRIVWRTRVATLAPEDPRLPPSARPRPVIGPCLYRGRVYLATQDGHLAAVDFESGAPVWMQAYARDADLLAYRRAGGWKWAPVLATGGYVVATPSDGAGLVVLPADAGFDRPVGGWRPAPHLPLRELPRAGSERLLAAERGWILLSGRDPARRFPLVRAIAVAADELREAPLPPPLDAPPAGAVAIAEDGVFLATGKYIYRVDPAGGDPGAPLVGEEAAGAGVLGPLVPFPGGLVAVTPQRITIYRARR